MIFASDLDRTLMYSARALKELGGAEDYVLKPVEWKGGRWVGFMTEAAFYFLQELSRQSLFIPVTTRTTEQFNRFVLFEQDIPLPYAITTNGAVILCRGRQLEEWSEHILQTMKKETAAIAEMSALLEREGYFFEGTLRQVENLFFYYSLTHLPASFDKATLQTLAAEHGWRISLQGRKLYFIPKAINKGDALEFICQRVGMKAVAGAGDSILDWDFLQYCDERFVPKHGELANMSEMDSCTLVEQSGIKAGEEIVQKFLNLFSIKCDSFKNKEIKAGK